MPQEEMPAIELTRLMEETKDVLDRIARNNGNQVRKSHKVREAKAHVEAIRHIVYGSPNIPRSLPSQAARTVLAMIDNVIQANASHCVFVLNVDKTKLIELTRNIEIDLIPKKPKI